MEFKVYQQTTSTLDTKVTVKLNLDEVEVEDIESDITYLDVDGNTLSTTILELQNGIEITIPANSEYVPVFVITAKDDYLNEVSEKLSMNISNPTNATLGTTSDTAIINDEEKIEDKDAVFAVIEGPTPTEEGSTTGNFTVKLIDKDGNPVTVTQDVDVEVIFKNGTAEDGDYVSIKQTVTITAANPNPTFTVDTDRDDDFDDETFTATIDSVENTGEFEKIDYTNAPTGFKNEVTATIIDNPVPTITPKPPVTGTNPDAPDAEDVNVVHEAGLRDGSTSETVEDTFKITSKDAVSSVLVGGKELVGMIADITVTTPNWNLNNYKL